MTPTEIAAHLEAQAETLEILATQCDDLQENEQAEKCRQSAKDARILAQQVLDNNQYVISELQKLQQLINECHNHNYPREACRTLKILIERFMLEKREPYSTHLTNCGFN
jgi:hypothetical protein